MRLKDWKRVRDLILTLGWNEAIDQLAMADGLRLYGRVLRVDYGHVSRMVLDSERGN